VGCGDLGGMVEVAGIQDRETLEAWLKSRSREDAVCIVHRAALRVAPLLWNDIQSSWVQKRGLTALSNMWPIVVSGVACKKPSPTVDAAARQAISIAVANFANANAQEASERAAFAPNGSDANADLSDAARSVDVAFASAIAVADANSTFGAAAAATDRAAIVAIDKSWLGVRMDCAALEAGVDPFALPLWDGPVPEPIAAAWTRTREDWAKAGGPVWAFLTQFFENALAGRPQDWPLLHDIALIPAEDWQGGPEQVHPIIEGMLLQRATQATNNSETIAFNTETGKAYLVPASPLPPYLAAYVKRKLAGALAIFETASANQYTALQPDLALLAEVVDEADNLPVELFDACASVSRRVIHRARMGECPDPEKDPLLADFLHRIREAGADILGNDLKTQEVLARRAGIAGNRAFTEGREVILSAAGLLASVSEGYLAKAMPRDAEVATNLGSEPEESKVSAFRLAGRLLRYPIAVAAVGGGAVIGVATFIQSYQVIMALPQVQAAIQVVLKYLGYI
jgi:hypothetical protein